MRHLVVDDRVLVRLPVVESEVLHVGHEAGALYTRDLHGGELAG
jgi:hypothetical protein